MQTAGRRPAFFVCSSLFRKGRLIFLPQVSVCQTESYDPARMQAAVRAHFEALDLARQIRPDLKIVIKPNLVMKRARGRRHHSPCLSRGGDPPAAELGAQDITIAESSGGPYAEPLLKSLYETCGMAEAARRTRGETESWHRQPGNRRKRPGHPPFYGN